MDEYIHLIDNHETTISESCNHYSSQLTGPALDSLVNKCGVFDRVD